ncbi:unnamed protein product [Acanthoscelides obtectus]|uniref:Tc1-like transposase DDE domain-containing protein n=1 Tax=Acanthoscelides obtectus TaxID=200917 RepID=A0A9P0KIN8_ACAOB|nr:unnamed protein product [Acanthoscelides obtectus]CAK1665014.1 hypothetical protein AOBTE_LOCUS24613 [Acanthoscelides obtectus]
MKKWKLDSFTPHQIKSIREIIYNFYMMEKKLPTLKGIRQKILDRGVLSEDVAELSISTLSRLLKKIGFKWQKMQDKRKVLCESYDIRAKRIKFLKKIIEFRKEGRNIVYTDETYIHSSHVKDKGWYDGSDKNLKKPISKGQRLIIVHAGGEKGFVQNGLLIFKSGTKTGDYHNEMNSKNFMIWVERQLLPNLPERSVLVVDNASYHNVPIKKNITTATRKAEMINWLETNGIPADPKLTKPELYKIISENKFRFPIKYRLDELLEKDGHCVLRLPPYHPELNPIEKIWALVKNWVAARNTTFRLPDTEALARQKFEEVTEQEWFNICQHVRKYENELIEKEHLLDEAVENLVFTVNTGSSEESEEGWDDDEAASEDELGCSILESDSSEQNDDVM